MPGFQFISSSIRRKILASFIGVFLFVVGIIGVAEWQLSQIASLSAKSVPRSRQMNAMQNFVASTTTIDMKLERFLIIRSANEQESLKTAAGELLQNARKFAMETNSDPEQYAAAITLQKKVESIDESINGISNRKISSLKSRELNITMKHLFTLIEEISTLQQQWSINAHATFKEEAASQGEILADMNRQFIALGICMLMAVIAAALLITRSIATPVQNLMQATNEIASGKLDARVSVKASDEIGHLAKIFNHMADQIQTLVRNLEERMKQLKESSEALKFSEGNLRITLQSIADAVIATDKDGNIIRMNPAAEKLTGWKDSQAKGKELPKVFDIKDESTREPIDNLIHKTLTMHETTNLPERTILTAKNGKEYKIADSAAPIRSDTGEIVGLVLVFRDITAEHELQTRLRHSQKMDAIGQLAGGIAHDFNNMLGGIIGAAELAMLLTSKGENPDKYIEMIIETADRAAELTSKLLAFARKQPSASATVDLNTPLQDALVLIENTADKRIKIHQEISENPLPVIGDPTQLQNTFLNLMLNAVQAMPEGGDIFITSDNTHITEDYCKASTFEMQPGEYASIEIRDTGCGIAQESIDRIYEPFFTTKQNSKGTGLGLAAVLGTVQQHKGSITAYSEKGNGTSFHLLFPMTEDRAPQRELLMKETIRGSGTILIVDDERVMRATASEILENLGYDTIIADNGQKGLELFKEHIDRIDLVILDMIMPEMNGRDCFMEMQKTSKDIPIILASGFSREEELQGMKEAGLKGFLHKPYRTVELSRTVHDVLTNE